MIFQNQFQAINLIKINMNTDKLTLSHNQWTTTQADSILQVEVYQLMINNNKCTSAKWFLNKVPTIKCTHSNSSSNTCKHNSRWTAGMQCSSQIYCPSQCNISSNRITGRSPSHLRGILASIKSLRSSIRAQGNRFSRLKMTINMRGRESIINVSNANSIQYMSKTISFATIWIVPQMLTGRRLN